MMKPCGESRRFAVRAHSELPAVHGKAESTIRALKVMVKGLRRAGWPGSVAAWCREMADGYARWVPPLEVLTRVRTQDEFDIAYENYAEVRGEGLQRSPTGVRIRRALGVPLAP